MTPLKFFWKFQRSANDITIPNMSMQYPRSHTLISSDFINIVKYKLIGSPTNPVNLELRSNLKKVGIITPAVNMMTAKRKSIWITWTFANLSLLKMTKVSDFLAVFCSLGKFQFQICWWQAADLNLYQYEILFFFYLYVQCIMTIDVKITLKKCGCLQK